MAGDTGEVLLGVRHDTASITAADGKYTPLQTDAEGNLRVLGALSNGSTADAHRNNTEITIWASAARTAATTNSADLANYNARGVRLFLNITAATGTTPTLDIKVQAKDSVSGTYHDLTGVAFAQQTTTASLDLVLYPGATVTANRSVSSPLPRTWRLVATIGGTDTPTFTFSLGASYTL